MNKKNRIIVLTDDVPYTVLRITREVCPVCDGDGQIAVGAAMVGDLHGVQAQVSENAALERQSCTCCNGRGIVPVVVSRVQLT